MLNCRLGKFPMKYLLGKFPMKYLGFPISDKKLETSHFSELVGKMIGYRIIARQGMNNHYQNSWRITIRTYTTT